MLRVMPARSFRAEGVNADTGEVIDIVGKLDQTAGRKHRTSERSHQVFLLTDHPQMHRLDLTGSQWRIFWAVVGVMHKDSGSLARVNTGEVAKTTGMSTSQASTVLTSLVSRRILDRAGLGVWNVNPWLVYAGSAADWEAATDGHPKPEWSRA